MSDDTLSRIAGWCGAEDDLDIDERTITVAGDPPVEIGVDLGEEAITLAHTYSATRVPAGFSDHVRELLGGRGSMISGEVETDEGETRVRIRYPIYLDGLNRQTFLLAIREITAAADGLDRMVASEPEPAAEPAPAPAAEPAAPVVAAAPAAEPEPVAAAEQPTTVGTPAAWAPTHTVPGGGMSAWSEPDPSLAPVATLAARVELRVDEQRGAWARVTGSNGWSGWVDARKLRPLPGSAPPAARPAAYPAAAAAGGSGLTLRPVALVGGILMIVGTFLDWIAAFGANGWDYGTGALWNGSLGQPRLGLVMLILGAAVILLAVLPRIPASALVLVGALGVLVMALFTVQVLRVLAAWQWEILWNGDLGIGLYLGLVGGILAMVPIETRL